jgi:hypothetical protein
MRPFATATLVVLLLMIPARASERPAAHTGLQHSTAVQSEETSTHGEIVGHAWNADNTPLVEERVRLRDVHTGLVMGMAVTDANGEFRIERVNAGAYVIEVVTERGEIRAVGKLFSVEPGRTRSMSVRLGAPAPWFPGFFGNTASDALAAAARLGLTAIGSSGLPASPQ